MQKRIMWLKEKNVSGYLPYHINIMRTINLPDLKFPKRLTVEFTNHCNFKCVMCPRQRLKENLGYLDMALYKKIITEAKEYLPVAFVPFFRGESLLHPHFFEMIDMAKKSGLGPIQLTTNAMLLDRELSIRLIETGLDFISFSLDVLGKSSYEKIRVGGDYELVMSNIENFLNIREKKNSRLPEVQVSTVETRKNKAGLDAFIGYWRKRADRVRVYPEHSSDGSYGSLSGYILPHFDKRLPCKKVFTDMVIYWDGTIAVCNHDWDRREYLGNIRDTSIENIWNGYKYKEIRKRHIDGNLEDDLTCKGCDHWKMYYIEEGLVGKIYKRDAA